MYCRAGNSFIKMAYLHFLTLIMDNQRIINIEPHRLLTNLGKMCLVVSHMVFFREYE